MGGGGSQRSANAAGTGASVPGVRRPDGGARLPGAVAHRAARANALAAGGLRGGAVGSGEVLSWVGVVGTGAGPARRGKAIDAGRKVKCPWLDKGCSPPR